MSNYQRWDTTGLYWDEAVGEQVISNLPSEWDLRSKSESEVKQMRLLEERIHAGMETQGPGAKIFKLDKGRGPLDRYGSL